MNEVILANAILGHRRPSVLMTDGYKFSMAQAGAPLRTETFHLVFRHGGPWHIPFDLAKLICLLLPQTLPDDSERLTLFRNGYQMTPAMERAVNLVRNSGHLGIWAAPQGSWVFGKEPILTVTGPSFIVSWLEPLALMLHFPIQVATEILNGRTEFRCTCPAEVAIVKATADEMGLDSVTVVLDESDLYRKGVARRAKALVDALEDKDPGRIFEVGMRAVSCMDMHRIALEECKKAGITKTSNVFLAHELEMIAVGTTGHEHVQRWGGDLPACRAIRDMRPGVPSYLPDTFDVMGMGIPAAIRALVERPDREGIVRFDSGDQWPQLVACETAFRKFSWQNPNYIFEDGVDDKKVVRDEEWCRKLGIVKSRRSFGSGQFLVKSEQTDLTRDRVAAVWKLCRTGETDVMKTCVSAPTKASLPGDPVTFRRIFGIPCAPGFEQFSGLAGQSGETPPEGFSLLETTEDPFEKPEFPVPEMGLSPATEKLVAECKKRLSVMV